MAATHEQPTEVQPAPPMATTATAAAAAEAAAAAAGPASAAPAPSTTASLPTPAALPPVRVQLPDTQTLPHTSAMEAVLQQLTGDASFSTSVAAANGQAAAVAALLFFKANWKSVASALKLPAGSAAPAPTAAAAMDCASPAHRRSSDGGWRGGDGGASDFRKGDRVAVVASSSNKKLPVPVHLLGKEGVVLVVRSNGFLKLAIGSETVEIQQRYVTYAPSSGRAGQTRSGATAAVAAAGLDRHLSLGRGGGRASAVGRKDLVRAVRKELTQLEERVPWSKVQDRWRTARRSWVRRLKGVEQLRDLALLMRELHDALKTDRSTGLFAAGGSWEAALRECVAGHGSPGALQRLWDDMKAALTAWLAADNAPGSSGSCERDAGRRALAAARLLLQAAAGGQELLDQVPLELILTSQRDVSALQAVIQQQTAAAQAALQAAAAGEPAGGAAEGAEAAAQAVAAVAGLLKAEGVPEGAAGVDGVASLGADLFADMMEVEVAAADLTDLEGEDWC